MSRLFLLAAVRNDEGEGDRWRQREMGVGRELWRLEEVAAVVGWSKIGGREGEGRRG
ncbi:conserved hypothetical protein [Ricinus communis]|uniref:Uncharacterized protein n=1 Tax=Ricinus communis TaxID=3988 RepID=B9RP27_RICCO|nr:conserved hypothetical protein [Ricinus communis]